MVDAQDALLPSAQGSTGRKRELSEDDANLAGTTSKKRVLAKSRNGGTNAEDDD